MGELNAAQLSSTGEVSLPGGWGWVTEDEGVRQSEKLWPVF